MTLPEETANHLVRVMRLREGDTCVLFNGDGHDYSATLTAAGKREVQVRIDAVQAVGNESPLAITLLQGIARGEKMDLILQKATELGVAAIIPVNAERTEVKLDAARAEKRVSHWNNVVTSACGQSGRASIPQVGPPLSLAQAAAALPADTLRLTLDPLGAHRLSTLDAAPAGGIVIAIGPEGAGRRATGISWQLQDSGACSWGHASCVPRPPGWPRLPHCRRGWAIWGEADSL